jgi:hypothetical protein
VNIVNTYLSFHDVAAIRAYDSGLLDSPLVLIIENVDGSTVQVAVYMHTPNKQLVAAVVDAISGAEAAAQAAAILYNGQ